MTSYPVTFADKAELMFYHARRFLTWWFSDRNTPVENDGLIALHLDEVEQFYQDNPGSKISRDVVALWASQHVPPLETEAIEDSRDLAAGGVAQVLSDQGLEWRDLDSDDLDVMAWIFLKCFYGFRRGAQYKNIGQDIALSFVPYVKCIKLPENKTKAMVVSLMELPGLYKAGGNRIFRWMNGIECLDNIGMSIRQDGDKDLPGGGSVKVSKSPRGGGIDWLRIVHPRGFFCAIMTWPQNGYENPDALTPGFGATLEGNNAIINFHPAFLDEFIEALQYENDYKAIDAMADFMKKIVTWIHPASRTFKHFLLLFSKESFPAILGRTDEFLDMLIRHGKLWGPDDRVRDIVCRKEYGSKHARQYAINVDKSWHPKTFQAQVHSLGNADYWSHDIEDKTSKNIMEYMRWMKMTPEQDAASMAIILETGNDIALGTLLAITEGSIPQGHPFAAVSSAKSSTFLTRTEVGMFDEPDKAARTERDLAIARELLSNPLTTWLWVSSPAYAGVQSKIPESGDGLTKEAIHDCMLRSNQVSILVLNGTQYLHPKLRALYLISAIESEYEITKSDAQNATFATQSTSFLRLDNRLGYKSFSESMRKIDGAFGGYSQLDVGDLEPIRQSVFDALRRHPEGNEAIIRELINGFICKPGEFDDLLTNIGVARSIVTYRGDGEAKRQINGMSLEEFVQSPGFQSYKLNAFEKLILAVKESQDLRAKLIESDSTDETWNRGTMAMFIMEYVDRNVLHDDCKTTLFKADRLNWTMAHAKNVEITMVPRQARIDYSVGKQHSYNEGYHNFTSSRGAFGRGSRRYENEINTHMAAVIRTYYSAMYKDKTKSVLQMLHKMAEDGKIPESFYNLPFGLHLNGSLRGCEEKTLTPLQTTVGPGMPAHLYIGMPIYLEGSRMCLSSTTYPAPGMTFPIERIANAMSEPLYKAAVIARSWFHALPAQSQAMIRRRVGSLKGENPLENMSILWLAATPWDAELYFKTPTIHAIEMSKTRIVGFFRHDMGKAVGYACVFSDDGGMFLNDKSFSHGYVRKTS